MKNTYYNTNGHQINTDFGKFGIVNRETNEIVCVFMGPKRFGGAHMHGYRPFPFGSLGLHFDTVFKYRSGNSINDLEVTHEYLGTERNEEMKKDAEVLSKMVKNDGEKFDIEVFMQIAKKYETD